jgi:L-amino acid N-acyltransferase YncA
MEPASSPSGTLLVRAAEERDIETIAAIYAHHVINGAASFELAPPSAEEMAERWRAIVCGGYPYLVAEAAGGEVRGYAYASAYRPRPAYRYTVENSVYVRQDGARRGTGRVLMTSLIAACEARGFRQMIAVIGDAAPASIGLHRSLGFTMVGTLAAVGHKFERWADVVLMQRALGPGAETPP